MPSSGAIVPTEKHAWRCIITKLCVGEQIRFATPGTGLDAPRYDGCGYSEILSLRGMCQLNSGSCIYMVRRRPAMRMVENSGRDPVDCERTRLSEFSSVRRACLIDGSS